MKDNLMLINSKMDFKKIMKREICIIVMLILFLYVCSCAVQPTIEFPMTQTIKPSYPLTEKANPVQPTVLAPSFTPTQNIIATSTPTILPTNASIPPRTIIKKNCLNILPDLPKDKKYNGTILLQRSGKGTETYLLNIGTGNRTLLPSYDISQMVVSPDGKWYAYRDFSTDRLNVVSSDNSSYYSIAYDHDLLNPYWVNNSNIIARTDERVPTVTVYNPFTNQKRLILPEYSDPDPDRTSFLAFDPELTRFAYAGLILTSQGEQIGEILWNVIEKKKIVELPIGDTTTSLQWSQDGTKIILFNSDFFEITRDGIVSQVTNLDSNLSINDMNISPDGRFVAMWLNTDGNPEDGSLAILDTTNGEMIDYCIKSGKNSISLYDSPTPRWSLDGKLLAIEGNFRSNEQKRNVILIDPKEEIAAIIANNASSKGWLFAP